MTRPIKFRAWSFQGKQMLMEAQEMYDGLGNWFDSKTKEIDPYKNFPTNSFGGMICAQEEGKIALMQFTGLLDCNGKELYEGDVVKASAKSSGVNDPMYDAIRGEGVQTLFCELDPHHLRVRFAQKPNGLFEYEAAELEEIIIIGNIYENPELLK